MRKITLGTTYYQNPKNLSEFIHQHYDHVDQLIVVDDGSITNPLSSIKLEDSQNKMKLFRVKRDYGFNSHGCRNLIVKRSSYDWIVLLDCDRLIVEPKYAFGLMREIKLESKIMYKFVAHFKRCGASTHRSVNDYLIHRDHFFSVGGYDEELMGVRDGDRSFFKQLTAAGGSERILQIDMLLTRKPSVSINGDTRSQRDRNLTAEMVDVLRSREIMPNPKKPILTFEWEEITRCT